VLKGLLPEFARSTLNDVGFMSSARQFHSRLEGLLPTPDVIVDYSFYWSDAAVRFGAERGIPVILNVEALTEDAMPAVARSLLRRWGQRADLMRLSAANRVWAVSTPLADALKKLEPAIHDRVDVVPNAADLPELTRDYLPRESSLSDNRHLVAFVGGLAPWYQVPRLVSACRQARRHIRGLRLLLIGDGPDRQVIERGMNSSDRDWCELAGRVSHAEVARRLREASICVIMNHTWWGSPLKLLEYGSLGKPVIAASVPSIRSMVSDREVLFVTPGAEKEMEAAIIELAQNDARRRALGLALRDRVHTDYSIEAMAGRIADSLSRVLTPRSPCESA
jgi:glycosyltransferase involved in cell wall biosynthesis